MAGIRNVISTLGDNGEEVMGPEVLLWHYPNNDIMNGSLLTVESNHFCVLKSRGAILNVYETGQYTVQTPCDLTTNLSLPVTHKLSSSWLVKPVENRAENRYSSAFDAYP